MALATNTKRQVLQPAGEANYFETKQIVIDTSWPLHLAGVAARVTVQTNCVDRNADGTRNSEQVVEGTYDQPIMASGTATPMIANSLRLAIAALGLTLPDEKNVDALLAAAQYAGIKQAVEAQRKADGIVPQDAA